MGEDFKDFEMEAPALTLEPDSGGIGAGSVRTAGSGADEAGAAGVDTGGAEDGGGFCCED